jgi:nicastrin
MRGALNVARMDAAMFASSNSTACISARTCLPLGGYSVWAALPPLPPPPPGGASPQAAAAAAAAAGGPVVLALASVDAGSLFHTLGQAADSPLSGLVAVLAAARALGEAWRRERHPYARRIAFAALVGEPWGLMGSRRLLWEMHDGSAAAAGLALGAVEGILEVGQVGRAGRVGGGVELFMHTDKRPAAGAGGEVAAALRAAAAATAEAAVAVAPASPAAPGLPPSSASAFLRLRPAIPAVVLAEFDASFVNAAYQAPHDTVDGVDLEAVAAAAAVAARALHALALGPSAAAAAAVPPLALNFTALRESVAALAGCLMTDSPGLRCPLAQALMTAAGGGRVPHYVGILNTVTADPQDADPAVKSDVERFIWNYLAVATSPDGGGPGGEAALPRCRHRNASACPSGTVCAGARDGVQGPAGTGACVNATARYVPAWSPRLECAGCNGSGSWGQARWAVGGGAAAAWEAAGGWPADPMWVESNWATGSPRVVMFLQETAAVERAVLGAGLAAVAAAAAGAAALHVAWHRRQKRD